MSDLVFPDLSGRENREQRIIGPPGCGKTTRLTRITDAAARQFGSDNVLICSLTRSAAGAISQAKVDGHRIPVPQQNVGTLHAFAYRALGKPEIADTPKRLADWNEWVTERGQPVYRITLDGGDLDDAATEGAVIQSMGDEAYSLYCIARSKCQPLETLPLYVQAFARHWEEFKSDFNCFDFAELFERAYADTETAPGDPSAILLDEAQDIPRLGMELARKWGRRTEWFFICGDPLQNLYWWAGTEPEAFTQPQLPADQQSVLDQSYRVPRKVQEVALRWVAPLKKRVEAQLGTEIAYHPRREKMPDGTLGEVVEGDVRALTAATWRYPEPAIRDAEKYLAAGKSVMFVTACSYMLAPLISKLRQHGLPYHNPYRMSRGDWNPLTSSRGTSSAQRLLQFLRLDERAWGDDVRLWTPRELWAWIEVVEAKGLLRHGAKDLIRSAASRPASIEADGETVPPSVTATDLEAWFEDIEAAFGLIELIGEGRGEEWLEQRLLSAKRKPMEFPLSISRKRGPAALRQKPQIIVGTIHSTKGGEADCTYLFPDLSQAGVANWARGGEEQDGIIRAFYVGLTRAMETLILCEQSSAAAIRWPSLRGL